MSGIERFARRGVMKMAPDSRLEKIRLFYLQSQVEQLEHDEPIKLTILEERLRVKLENIFELLTSYKHPRTVKEVRDLVYSWPDVTSASMAYRLVRQAQELFGEIDQVERNTLRSIQTKLYQSAKKEIMSDPDLSSFERHELILKINARIDKINHLEDKDSLNLSQILELLEMPDTEFTTDTEALTQDVEHEEVE